MAVVDLHSLGLVHTLNLSDEVERSLNATTEFKELCRVQRALIELGTGNNAVAIFDKQTRAKWELVDVVLVLRVWLGAVEDLNGQRLLSTLD